MKISEIALIAIGVGAAVVVGHRLITIARAEGTDSKAGDYMGYVPVSLGILNANPGAFAFSDVVSETNERSNLEHDKNFSGAIERAMERMRRVQGAALLDNNTLLAVQTGSYRYAQYAGANYVSMIQQGAILPAINPLIVSDPVALNAALSNFSAAMQPGMDGAAGDWALAIASLVTPPVIPLPRDASGDSGHGPGGPSSGGTSTATATDTPAHGLSTEQAASFSTVDVSAALGLAPTAPSPSLPSTTPPASFIDVFDIAMNPDLAGMAGISAYGEHNPGNNPNSQQSPGDLAQFSGQHDMAPGGIGAAGGGDGGGVGADGIGGPGAGGMGSPGGIGGGGSGAPGGSSDQGPGSW